MKYKLVYLCWEGWWEWLQTILFYPPTLYVRGKEQHQHENSSHYVYVHILWYVTKYVYIFGNDQDRTATDKYIFTLEGSFSLLSNLCQRITTKLVRLETLQFFWRILQIIDQGWQNLCPHADMATPGLATILETVTCKIEHPEKKNPFQSWNISFVDSVCLCGIRYLLAP